MNNTISLEFNPDISYLKKNLESVNKVVKNLQDTTSSANDKMQKAFNTTGQIMDKAFSDESIKTFGSTWAQVGKDLTTTATDFASAFSGAFNLEEANTLAALGEAFNAIELNGIGEAFSGTQQIIDGMNSLVEIKGKLTEEGGFLEQFKGAPQNLDELAGKVKKVGENLTFSSIKSTIWNTVSHIGAIATSAFGVAMAFLQSPIFLAVLAITALIAIGYLLIKNWDTVKIFLLNCWEGIKAVASIVWEGIKAVISVVMTIIQTIIETIWTVIYTIITTILGIIKTVITTIWEGIKVAISVIMTVIKTIIETVWTVISTVITTILGIIKTVITTVWQGIQLIITTVLSIISEIIRVAWEGIKLIISTVLNVIFTIIQTVWNTIKGIIQTVCEGIRMVISTVWNAITSVISGVVNGIRTIVSTGFQWVSDKVSGIFNGLKDVVMGIWKGIGSGIQGVVNGIISVINGMVRAMNKISFDIPDWVPVLGGKKFGFNIPEIQKVSWFATGGIIKGSKSGTIIGVGESGDEAILPLSDKGRMKPFARAVSDYMPDKYSIQTVGASGVNISVGKLVVREESDINKIAEQLFRLQQRNLRARGKY